MVCKECYICTGENIFGSTAAVWIHPTGSAVDKHTHTHTQHMHTHTHTHNHECRIFYKYHATTVWLEAGVGLLKGTQAAVE